MWELRKKVRVPYRNKVREMFGELCKRILTTSLLAAKDDADDADDVEKTAASSSSSPKR